MKNLDDALSRIGNFLYIRSYGNLGDLLIAEATEQYFAQKGYDYQIVKPDAVIEQNHTLVHGGGARFTADWCDVDTCIRVLCNEKVEKCVILPSSFHEVDELVKHFDARHTIFCRDARSYEYCCSMCPDSQVYLTDDMAVHLNLNDMVPTGLDESANGEEEIRLQEALRVYLYRWMQRGMRRASVTARIGGTKRRVAFLMRTDKEKRISLSSPMSYDISLIWHAPSKNKYNANLLLAMSNALRMSDVIVSDRLHVCIMAYLSGLEVYMVDNTYGKLKGVYEQSLSACPRVHLVQSHSMPPELQKAWKKMNAVTRRLFYWGEDTCRAWLKRVMRRK